MHGDWARSGLGGGPMRGGPRRSRSMGRRAGRVASAPSSGRPRPWPAASRPTGASRRSARWGCARRVASGDAPLTRDLRCEDVVRGLAFRWAFPRLSNLMVPRVWLNVWCGCSVWALAAGTLLPSPTPLRSPSFTPSHPISLVLPYRLPSRVRTPHGVVEQLQGLQWVAHVRSLPSPWRAPLHDPDGERAGGWPAGPATDRRRPTARRGSCPRPTTRGSPRLRSWGSGGNHTDADSIGTPFPSLPPRPSPPAHPAQLTDHPCCYLFSAVTPPSQLHWPLFPCGAPRTGRTASRPPAVCWSKAGACEREGERDWGRYWPARSSASALSLDVVFFFFFHPPLHPQLPRLWHCRGRAARGRAGPPPPLTSSRGRPPLPDSIPPFHRP